MRIVSQENLDTPPESPLDSMKRNSRTPLTVAKNQGKASNLFFDQKGRRILIKNPSEAKFDQKTGKYLVKLDPMAQDNQDKFRLLNDNHVSGAQ